MGIAGPLVGWGIYRVLRDTRVGIYATVFLAAAFADLFTYVVTSLELALAYPAQVGGMGSSFVAFMGIFAVTQVPLAILESIVLVLVFKYIVQLRPGILIRLKVFPEGKIMAAGRDA
jgi:cobalt/nickel transport system permease protein